MRRNVLNLSRLSMQSLFCKNEIPKNLLSKYLSQCRLASIPDGSRISEIKLRDSRPYTQTKVTNCWNCQKPMDVNIAGAKESFFCSSCGCLQEVNVTYTYFTLFGINEQFQVNQNELTKKFRDFQSVLHPDKFSNKSEAEQSLSATISSLVNKAYKTLNTPIVRAEYLLELKGITIPEDNNVVDKEFLFEIMERNEEVEDADVAVDLKTLLLRVNDDKEKYFADLDLNLRRDDLMAAKSCLILLRYYTSLETSIKNKLSKLEILD